MPRRLANKIDVIINGFVAVEFENVWVDKREEVVGLSKSEVFYIYNTKAIRSLAKIRVNDDLVIVDVEYAF